MFNQGKDLCDMDNNTPRIVIETIVRKTLRDIKDSPERSIRNLVDMALHFSNGRFHRSFLQMAQTMLKNEISPYYGLIEDTVCNVDSERLLQFGVNVGYNSCTAGANIIRELEAREHYNIPWAISLCIDSDFFSEHHKEYSRLISQGEEIGIYTWMIFSAKDSADILPLVQEHPDSAFILFCNPEDITLSYTDTACECGNLMTVVRYGDDAAEACELLRDTKLLYSVYSSYTESDVNAITSGELFYSTQQLRPVFTILLADSGCPETARQTVYETVERARSRQMYKTIVMETVCDSCFIDSIISSEACMAGFDSQGYLYTLQGVKRKENLNFLNNNLPDILKMVFPKSEQDS